MCGQLNVELHDRIAEAGETLRFDRACASEWSDDIIECNWQFSDGFREHNWDCTVERHFEAVGDYTLSLSVKNRCGDVLRNAGADIKIIDCSVNEPPIADIDETVLADLIQPGDHVVFDGSNSTDDAGVANIEYNWSVYGVPLGTGATVEHEFEDEGSYMVELLITDHCGDTDATEVMITVAVGNSDTLFEISSNPAGAGITVRMMALVPEAAAAAYLWSFGDGESDFGREVTHAYENTGEFDVRLVVLLAAGGSVDETQVLSVVEEDPMTLVGLFDGNTVGDIRGVAVLNNTAWVVTQTGSWVAADVTDPANPVLEDTGSVCWHAFDVAISGTLVAVASGHCGVHLFDAQDGALFDEQLGNVTPIGHYDTYAIDEAYAYGVAFVGDRLYVSCGRSLRILDISDPAAPCHMESLDIGYVNNRIVVSGTRAYVGVSSPFSSVAILDITDADDPLQLGAALTEARPFDMDVEGDLLAVTENGDGTSESRGKLAFFDVSNPVDPIFLSRLGSPFSTYRRVALHSDAAFVTSMATVCEVNISAPGAPFVMDALTLDFIAGAIECGDGGLLYVGLSGDATLGVLQP